VRFVSDDRVRARAQELYALALTDAEWTSEEVCARTGWTREELFAALEALTVLGLAAPFESAPSGWSVRSPATAMAELVESNHRHTEELLTAVANARTALAQVVAEFQPIHVRQLSDARIEVAVQPAQVAAIMEEASRSATTEVLTLHPGPPLPAAQLAAGRGRNHDTLGRGVAMRSIHLASSAAVPHLRAHLRELVKEGGEVRTATTLPMRLIIVDRTLAIVPAFDPDSLQLTGRTGNVQNAAMVLRGPAMVSVLRQVFEHCWATASDLIPEEGGGAVSRSRHREVVRLLASGLTDEAIGRKLGLSDRTVRRIVAELMQQIGADSRFQAGVKMVRLGWLDDDPVPFKDVVGSTPAVG
jgi:DNA-binding CsgD family transcriptional regulator